MIGRPPHRADDRGIDLELLVFARRALGVQEQELGPEQPDADGPAVEASLDFAAELDIAPELDAAAVLGLGGQVGLAGQDLKPGRSLGGDLVISLLGFRVGVEDDQALVAIDDGHPAMPGAVQELAQADHGRDLQRGRDDRGMAGAAAGLGGEARDEAGVEPGGLAGRQVVRQHDRRRRQVVLERLGPARRSTGSRIRASMSRTSAARAARCEPESRSSREA